MSLLWLRLVARQLLPQPEPLLLLLELLLLLVELPQVLQLLPLLLHAELLQLLLELLLLEVQPRVLLPLLLPLLALGVPAAPLAVDALGHRGQTPAVQHVSSRARDASREGERRRLER